MDDRNKKRLQLESQVGVATSYLSNRGSSSRENRSSAFTDQLVAVLSTLNLLISKLSKLSEPGTAKTPVVNVSNWPCHPKKSVMLDKAF